MVDLATQTTELSLQKAGNPYLGEQEGVSNWSVDRKSDVSVFAHWIANTNAQLQSFVKSSRYKE